MKTLYKKDKIVNEVACYIASTYLAEPEMIFKNDFTSVVFRHRMNNKWFGLVMQIDGEKLGLKNRGQVFVINLKLDPLFIMSIVDGEHVFPSYHMNKTHWVSVVLDEKLDKNKLYMMLDMSFNLTK